MNESFQSFTAQSCRQRTAATANQSPIISRAGPDFQACLQFLETFPFLLSSQIPNHYDNSMWILSKNYALELGWNQQWKSGVTSEIQFQYQSKSLGIVLSTEAGKNLFWSMLK